MRRFALIAALMVPALIPLNANAEGIWKTMTGDEIKTALSDKKLKYASATQTFTASGETAYNQDGRLSNGSWRVENNQYCSVWPPQGQWACYHMDRSGNKIRFIGTGDDITVGTYIE